MIVDLKPYSNQVLFLIRVDVEWIQDYKIQVGQLLGYFKNFIQKIHYLSFFNQNNIIL
jgi:hypothetical protein